MKSQVHKKILIGLLCLSSLAVPAGAEDVDLLTNFKAVFVYNFLDYVHWPEGDGTEVIKIGILGDSPLEEPLRKIAERKSTEKRKIRVAVRKDVEDLGDCHVLFIPSGQVGRLKEIKAYLIDQSVLTVTDTPGLANRGVAINFILVKGKLKFEINQQALQRAGLRASAQLLKLAILVEEEETG